MNPASDERKSALFAGLIMQQSNMALMFLGKMPHPETGQPIHDLESAQIFIDQLEMLEEKTQGNLSADEAHLLKDTLTGLRMAFVEAVNHPPTPAEKKENPPPASQPDPIPPAPEAAPTPTENTAPAPEDSESRKKFTKKY